MSTGNYNSLSGGSLLEAQEPSRHIELSGRNDSLAASVLLRGALQAATGNTLRAAQEPAALERAEQIAQAHGLTLGQLLLNLASQPERHECRALVDAFLIKTTWFMREHKGIRGLVSELSTAAARHHRREVSLWTVGCATGEEPYSVVMAALDAGLQPRVLATDLSETALATAADATYPLDALRNVAARWAAKYFERADAAHVRLVKSVRDCVTFQKMNLADTASGTVPGRLDAVVCRNVLIYFQTADARQVLLKLAGSLSVGGLLLLGAAEQDLARGVPHLGGHGSSGWLLCKQPGLAATRRDADSPEPLDDAPGALSLRTSLVRTCEAADDLAGYLRSIGLWQS